MILITGASGLVGEAIYSEIINRHQIVGTSFSSSNTNFIKIDLTNKNDVANLFKKYNFTIVIHCAIIIPTDILNTNAMEEYNGNVRMVANILDNISVNTRFINISGTAIYDLKGDNALSETANIKCETLYQLAKQHIEDILYIYYKNNISNFLNIRISSPYSIKRVSDTVLYKFINSAKYYNKIILWGSGKRTQAFTNIKTFAEDLSLLLDNKFYGTYNYVTTSRISMQDLAKRISSIKKDLIVKYSGKLDPEDENRTSIDVSSISRYIRQRDTLNDDIIFIMENML